MCITSRWFLPVESYSVSLFTGATLYDNGTLLCVPYMNRWGATLLWSARARRRTETARHRLQHPTSKQCTWNSSHAMVYEAPILCCFFVHSVIHLLLYARMIQRCSSEFRFVQSPPPTSPNATSVRLFCLVVVVFFFSFLWKTFACAKVTAQEIRPYVPYLLKTLLCPEE